MNQSKNRERILTLCVAAMMTALVTAGNFARIVLPLSVGGVTAFTLGNIMCTLSGLLLGPWWGFAAAGLGSLLYDLTQGYYAHEAFITFFVKGVYGLVHSVDGDDFEYVYADNSSHGMVSWKGKGDIDDLGSSDTIYSRYEGKNKDALANGEKATVTNVNKLLDKLDDDKKFKDGATWRNKDEYESDVLGDAKGTEAFAYKLSDEIFGDLPYRTHDDHDEMLPGDILYMDEDEVYVVILSVDTKKEEFTYVWADDYYQEIDWNCKGSYEDFTRYDKVYTRYPEDLKSEDKKDENKKDDTLTNGKAITEKNVEALLADLWKKHEGEDWEDESWTSKAFTSKKVYADQAFAYYISDKIFGDSLKVSELTRVSKLQAGDVIKLGREYIVVYEVDQDEETFRYLYLDDYYEVEISSTSSNSSRWTDLDEIDTKTDTIYTRYPS